MLIVIRNIMYYKMEDKLKKNNGFVCYCEMFNDGNNK